MRKISMIMLLTGLVLCTASCGNKNTDANHVANTDPDISIAASSESPHQAEESVRSSVNNSTASESKPQSEKPESKTSTDITESSQESSVQESSSKYSTTDTQQFSENTSAVASAASEAAQVSVEEISQEEAETRPVPDDTGVIDNYLSLHTKVTSVSAVWEQQDNADGYYIQCSPFADFPDDSTLTVRTEKLSAEFNNLEINSVYYLRAASYHSQNGKEKVSDWTKRKEIKLKEIKQIDGVTYVDGMIIANKTYGLPEYYGDGLTNDTYAAYEQMVAGAAQDGIELYMISGFRSYEIQSYTYQSFVNDRGTELADLCSARPGHSEHQTGMAIDFNTTSDYFASTPEAIWIEQHCTEYGFILRYPKGKEEITGYKYEPWHVRYVGKKRAAEIADSGLTVEEYYGITSVYQN